VIDPTPDFGQNPRVRPFRRQLTKKIRKILMQITEMTDPTQNDIKRPQITYIRLKDSSETY